VLYALRMQLKTTGFKIISSGSAISDRPTSNVTLRAETADWVESRLGIHERHHLAESELLIDLVEKAALKTLKNGGIDASELTAIVIATSTPDFVNPSMAAILHGRLKASSDCASFDLQAVCAGFVYGLSTIASMTAAGAGKYFLLVGADQFSKITDFDDRNCVFFGDAAAAILIESTDDDNFMAVELHSEGSGWESFHTSREKGTFFMNAKEVSQNATTKLPASIRSICSYAGIEPKDISLYVTHQPSKPVLDSLEASLNLEPGRLLRNIKYRGNTAGATIPLLFDEMNVISKSKKGDYICFSAIGSGWVWGSAILKWA
jgi:3-oxoacyl-[acyl-carrier-protein] synthase III